MTFAAGLLRSEREIILENVNKEPPKKEPSSNNSNASSRTTQWQILSKCGEKTTHGRRKAEYWGPGWVLEGPGQDMLIARMASTRTMVSSAGWVMVLMLVCIVVPLPCWGSGVEGEEDLTSMSDTTIMNLCEARCKARCMDRWVSHPDK